MSAELDSLLFQTQCLSCLSCLTACLLSTASAFFRRVSCSEHSLIKCGLCLKHYGSESNLVNASLYDEILNLLKIPSTRLYLSLFSFWAGSDWKEGGLLLTRGTTVYNGVEWISIQLECFENAAASLLHIVYSCRRWMNKALTNVIILEYYFPEVISHPESTPFLILSVDGKPSPALPSFVGISSANPWSFPTHPASAPNSTSPTTPTDVCVCVCITSPGEDKTTRTMLPWWQLWNPRHAPAELWWLSKSLHSYNSPSPPSYSESQAQTHSRKSSMLFAVAWLRRDWIMIRQLADKLVSADESIWWTLAGWSLLRDSSSQNMRMSSQMGWYNQKVEHRFDLLLNFKYVEFGTMKLWDMR